MVSPEVASNTLSEAELRSVDLDQVNLVDPGWFADGPPHELFARMRARGAGALERASPRAAASGR